MKSAFLLRGGSVFFIVVQPGGLPSENTKPYAMDEPVRQAGSVDGYQSRV